VVAAAAVVALAGCGGEGQQAGTDLPPVSSSAAESTPDLPPLGPPDLPMPTEARVQDEAGAEAFVRYYIELINRTSSVMDAEPLRDFSEECRECDRIAANIDEDAAKGYRYVDGRLDITDLYSSKLKSDQAEIGFVVDQQALQVVDANGTVNEDLSSGQFTDLFSGALLTWDRERSTWGMSILTLG
jgi:hypothetical protein